MPVMRPRLAWGRLWWVLRSQPWRAGEHVESESNSESPVDGKKRGKGTTYGAATALGVGVGVALYSATSLPDWLAVGIGVAIWVGVVMEGRSKS